MLRAVVKGYGAYLPEKILTNTELEKRIDTTDAWITERTGIRQRHIAAENEFTSDLATKAAQKAIEASGIPASEIDVILVATTTPDNTFPATAAAVQAKLGLAGCGAFDLQAVCSGFVYGLSVADAYIRSGLYKTILLIGADTLSRIVDWNDRGTCILFGDGAGAVLIQAEESDRGVLATTIHADGATRELLYVNGGAGSSATSGVIHMNGREVFKRAVQFMCASTHEVLEAADESLDAVDWVVPHQANQRILNATVDRLGVPHEKLISCVAQHGNTSAASIPLALCDAANQGKLKKGQLVAMQAVGGGLTWGAALVRW
ncbi:MAG: ketoacyl-ACP synthase III [Rickettsiales bacterium]|nr:ketoacyl-ACP synthase III [Rickettsiales bacterium]